MRAVQIHIQTASLTTQQKAISMDLDQYLEIILKNWFENVKEAQPFYPHPYSWLQGDNTTNSLINITQNIMIQQSTSTAFEEFGFALP